MLSEVGRIRQQARRGVYERRDQSCARQRIRNANCLEFADLLALTAYKSNRKLKFSDSRPKLSVTINKMTARLNVNIDHVATVRQARRAPEPSVVAAAMLCEQAGADGITIHLRGDRRHIQDADVADAARERHHLSESGDGGDRRDAEGGA